jgi:hypothetical protein
MPSEAEVEAAAKVLRQELGFAEDSLEYWKDQAHAALTAAEKVRANERRLLRPQTLSGPAVDRDRAVKDDSGGP